MKFSSETNLNFGYSFRINQGINSQHYHNLRLRIKVKDLNLDLI